MDSDEQPATLESSLHRRARLFAVLSFLWIFPSAGALWILLLDPIPLPGDRTFADWLESILIEQWLALILLVIHCCFVFLAMRLRKRERSERATEL